MLCRSCLRSSGGRWQNHSSEAHGSADSAGLDSDALVIPIGIADKMRSVRAESFEQYRKVIVLLPMQNETNFRLGRTIAFAISCFDKIESQSNRFQEYRHPANAGVSVSNESFTFRLQGTWISDQKGLVAGILFWEWRLAADTAVS